jgi:hypothetical protein
MFIPDPDFFPSRIRIPDPEVKTAPDPGSGSAILAINPGCDWLRSTKNSPRSTVAKHKDFYIRPDLDPHLSWVMHYQHCATKLSGLIPGISYCSVESAVIYPAVYTGLSWTLSPR